MIAHELMKRASKKLLGNTAIVARQIIVVISLPAVDLLRRNPKLKSVLVDLELWKCFKDRSAYLAIDMIMSRINGAARVLSR